MKPALSVAENLGFWQRILLASRMLDVDEALDMVGLRRHRPPAFRLSLDRPEAARRDRPAAGQLPARLAARRADRRAGRAAETRFAALDGRAICDDGGIIVAATHVPLGLEPAPSNSL